MWCIGVTYKYVESRSISLHTCHIDVYTIQWHFSGPCSTGTIHTKPGHFCVPNTAFWTPGQTASNQDCPGKTGTVGHLEIACLISLKTINTVIIIIIIDISGRRRNSSMPRSCCSQYQIFSVIELHRLIPPHLVQSCFKCHDSWCWHDIVWQWIPRIYYSH